MKKLSLLIAIILSAIVSFAQFTPNPQGTAQQVTQFRGAVTGLRGTIITPNDTLNSPATPYFGALTVLPSDAGKADIPIWMSNGIYWIRFTGGTAININDTIYTRKPIAVDTTTLPGKRILYLLHLNGLESGGIVTKADCWKIGITSAIYYLNYKQYITASTTKDIDTADATFGRIDRVVVDTNLVVSVLKGTPSVTPIAPSINPSSQIELAQITIPAAASCLDILIKVIYDENIEWATSHGGTMTVDFDNPDNPFHLTKAAFVSVYNNGSSLIFTDSGLDTVRAGEILKMFIYLNGLFANQFQVQFYLNGTPVGNAVAFNSGYGFDPLNINFYQNVSIPFSAFNLNGGQVFNKLVITMAGSDLSGANGYYVDYIQLQTGIINTGTQFPTTLQIATDNSIAAGDNPYINNRMNSFVIDSLDEMDIISYGTKGINLLVKDPSTGAVLTNRSSDNQRIFDFIQNPDGINSVSLTQSSDIQGNIIQMAGGSAGSANLKLVITNLDTLLSPPTYIAAFEGDSLKKVAYPTGFGNDSVYVDVTAPTDSTLDFRRLNGGHTIAFIQGAGGGGTENLQQAFDVSPTAVPQINAHGNPIFFDSSNVILRSENSIFGIFAPVSGAQSFLAVNVLGKPGLVFKNSTADGGSYATFHADSINTTNRDYQLPDGDGVLGLSVNNIPFDANGNVNTSGSGTPNLQQVTDVGHVTTRPIQADSSITVQGVLNGSNVAVINSSTNHAVSIETNSSTGLPEIGFEVFPNAFTLLHADSSYGKTVQLPNSNGYLAHSVNNTIADRSGNIDLVVYPNQAVPYGNGTTTPIFDVGGLFYDGTYLTVGHNNAGVLSGIYLNAGRATLSASLDGLNINMGSGIVPGTYDAAKAFTINNRGNEYMRIKTEGTGPYTHRATFHTLFNIDSLKTGVTAPVTSGTIKMVITDANGQLSFQSIPTTQNLQQVTDVGFITSNPLISTNSILSQGDGSLDVEVSVQNTATSSVAKLDVSILGAPRLFLGNAIGGTMEFNINNVTAARHLESPDADGTLSLIETSTQITSGAVAPASTPAKVGDIYVDTSAKKLYFATGTSSSADWTIAN